MSDNALMDDKSELKRQKAELRKKARQRPRSVRGRDGMLREMRRTQRSMGRDQRAKEIECFWTWPWGHVKGDDYCAVCRKYIGSKTYP